VKRQVGGGELANTTARKADQVGSDDYVGRSTIIRDRESFKCTKDVVRAEDILLIIAVTPEDPPFNSGPFYPFQIMDQSPAQCYSHLDTYNHHQRKTAHTIFTKDLSVYKFHFKEITGKMWEDPTAESSGMYVHPPSPTI
jgi:hypothetical protein